MRKLVTAIVASLILIPASALWAAETQANKEQAAVSANAEDVTIGGMGNEIMDQDAISEPMPPKEVAHKDDMHKAPVTEPAMAEGMAMQEAVKDNDKMDHGKDGEKGMCAACMMKKNSPKDMVMMNMMMRKMKNMKGPNVVATYDGGIVVIEGNKITKYDDELNYVNELNVKANKHGSLQ